jgi:transposase
MMSRMVLGIDISKKSFDATLLTLQQAYTGHFSNDPAGYGRMARWLEKRKAKQVHACLEATNRYWEELAYFLDEEGHQVSVVNPKLIKKHAEATMQRNKTDRQDAATIADYCLKHEPDAWIPPPASYRELQAMVRHVEALKVDRQRERNRQKSGIPSQRVQASIAQHVAFIDEQIAQLEEQINDHIDQDPDLKADKELLTSIPGIGDIVAATFIAEVPDVRRFEHASQLAAFAGLTPGQHHSGSSIHRPGKLIKWGNTHLRRALYMPALSAHKWNPTIATYRERLIERGKRKMTIIVAVMRKLIHLCYGVLKTRMPFDPEYSKKELIPT